MIKTRETLKSNKYFIYNRIKFLITKHISNHIIKNNQCLAFLIWILFFNIFINVIHISMLSSCDAWVSEWIYLYSCLNVSLALKRLSLHLRSKWLWVRIRLLSSSISFEYFIKASESLKCFMSILRRFSIKIDILLRTDRWYANKFYQHLVGDLIDEEIHLFFLIRNLQLMIFFNVFFCYITTVKISVLFYLLLHLISYFLHTRWFHMRMFLSNQLVTFFIITWI